MVAGVAGCNGVSSPWRFLKVDEARILAAVCDALIPPDADPGAEWAHAVNYIDIQLCGHYRKLRESYRAGLACLEQQAQKASGKGFAAMTAAEQTALLAQLERGEAPAGLWTKPAAKDFFNLMLEHTMQGYYGDPRHGGNRDRVSWKMLGLPAEPIRGRYRAGQEAQKG